MSGALEGPSRRVTQVHVPGKVILLGEHAVVYGRPAIAVPVTDVRATATVEDRAGTPGVLLRAPDIGLTTDVSAAPEREPLSVTVRNTLAHLGVSLQHVSYTVTIQSSIPVASGLGSGAAVATAVVRALAAHLYCSLDPAAVSAIVYETEKIHHGTPSGIDNTVVAFEKPVRFCRGRPFVALSVPCPFWLAIADTGIASSTRAAVAQVRDAYQQDPQRYERIFDQIAVLVEAGRRAIEDGKTDDLGPLLDENQHWLRTLRVSSPELERLIAAARQGGARGAKLCGGGKGGNMIALVEPGQAQEVKRALLAAGAARAIVTRVA